MEIASPRAFSPSLGSQPVRLYGRGEVRFTRKLSGLAGYRWLKFTLVYEPDVRVQNEVFAGLRGKLQ
jgi:hypothetical protein